MHGYWPMAIGNRWEYNYNYQFRDWNIFAVGRANEGTYWGTLTWEIVSTAETDAGFVATFRQRFMGMASEHRLVTDQPVQWETVTFAVTDTTSAFDLTIGTDSQVKASGYPTADWNGGCFQSFILGQLRVPEFASDADSLSFPTATLVRGVGPVSMSFSQGGNTTRRFLTASLNTYTQRNERLTTVATALARLDRPR
jgi:hypothetical protein